MAKQVRATKVGFFGGVLRSPGEVFSVSDDTKLSKWLEAVKPEKTTAPVPTLKASPAKGGKGKEDSELA